MSDLDGLAALMADAADAAAGLDLAERRNRAVSPSRN